MQQRIQQVQDKVNQLMARAEQLYGVRMPAVRIRFDLTGRAAGIAGCMINRWTREASDFYLRFNTSHMRSDTDWPHLINDVVPHEIAHTVCQAFPRLGKHHDAGWQRVCLALGGNGRRTYSAADAPEAVARQRPVQYVSTTGSVSLGCTNWPAAGSVGELNLTINITNTAYTLTLPASVSAGLFGIQGISPGTAGVSNTITFGVTGEFTFRFTTTDSGTTITIFDFSRSLDRFYSTVEIQNNTVSTSPTTGALIVDGGTGIQGNLNVGGNLVTYTSAGNVAFQALDTGIVEFRTPALIAGNSAGALNIVGSADGSYQPVYNSGSMVHVTGNDGVSNRITLDTFGTGAAIQTSVVLRLARGTAAAPTAVQSGDILGRITSSGFGNASQYVLAAGNIGTLGIDFVTLENYTTANAGSALKFYTSPIGAVTKTLSANVTANVSTFPSVSATGNIVATGNVVLNDGGTLGYVAGAGGTVSQSGNKSGNVTLNKPSGEITMQNTNLAADTTVDFYLTNSTITPTDLLIINQTSTANAGGYVFNAICNTGNAHIFVRNIMAATAGDAVVLRYAVVRGATT